MYSILTLAVKSEKLLITIISAFTALILLSVSMPFGHTMQWNGYQDDCQDDHSEDTLQMCNALNESTLPPQLPDIKSSEGDSGEYVYVTFLPNGGEPKEKVVVAYELGVFLDFTETTEYFTREGFEQVGWGRKGIVLLKGY